MEEVPRPRDELLASLPPEPETALLWQEIQESVSRPGQHVVVLDDDPTGVQTVHDVDVLTTWGTSDLSAALQDSSSLFYVLTNSRALDRPNAVARAREIAANLARIDTGADIDIISRGDSTLRGHYPWEVDPLFELYGPDGPDGHLIVPAFPEGGRITVDGVHYVDEDGVFVPVGRTDFASDPTFGFRSSFLPSWVEEKTGGRWRATDVLHVPLTLLRGGDPDSVSAVLMRARGNQPIVADAASYADLIVLVAALLRARAQGYRFLARTAASFVKIRGAISDQPFLTAGQVPRTAPGAAGLVLVGSYVKRTTEQLVEALRLPGVAGRELDVQPLVEGKSEQTVEALAAWADEQLIRGRVPLIYTSRGLVARHEDRGHVQLASLVSAALAAVPAHLSTAPGWLLVKGGITSSDVATDGLGVRRGRVLGQLGAGISVWRLGPESRFPGMSYIVFPGNVGRRDTLAAVISALTESTG